MAGHGDARGAFDSIEERFRRAPRVTAGTGFGSNPGLRVGGKIFAMLSNNALVVKLPAARVDELVEQHVAERFDAGKGRPMREWATVSTEHGAQWDDLAAEAFEFVGGGTAQRR